MNEIEEFSKVSIWMTLVQSSISTSILLFDLHPPTSLSILSPDPVTRPTTLTARITLCSPQSESVRCSWECGSRTGVSPGTRVAIRTGYLYITCFPIIFTCLEHMCLYCKITKIRKVVGKRTFSFHLS